MKSPARESPLSVRRLQQLVALADHGSTTAAAHAAGVTQPALTQSLRALEQRFGVPLTQRVGRRIVLTAGARILVDYARRIIRLADEAGIAVGDVAGLKRGHLALGASTTPGTYLLPALLGTFRARHPDISLELRIGDTRDVEQWVLHGEVDFGVTGELREQFGLAVTPFRRDELVLIAPRAHPFARRRVLDAEALASEPLIVRERGSSTRETLERRLAESGRGVTVLLELGSTEAILQAVTAGLGPSVVSTLVVEASPYARRLRVRRVTRLDLTRYLATVRRPGESPSPAAARFLALLDPGASP